MPASNLTEIAVNALEDLKGIDIEVLDVRDITDVTDTMIICTGRSSRHVNSLAQSVIDKAKEHNMPPYYPSNETNNEWRLVDLGDVVIHTMTKETRAFYDLESLWGMTAAAENAS